MGKLKAFGTLFSKVVKGENPKAAAQEAFKEVTAPFAEVAKDVARGDIGGAVSGISNAVTELSPVSDINELGQGISQLTGQAPATDAYDDGFAEPFAEATPVFEPPPSNGQRSTQGLDFSRPLQGAQFTAGTGAAADGSRAAPTADPNAAPVVTQNADGGTTTSQLNTDGTTTTTTQAVDGTTTSAVTTANTGMNTELSFPSGILRTPAASLDCHLACCKQFEGQSGPEAEAAQLACHLKCGAAGGCCSVCSSKSSHSRKRKTKRKVSRRKRSSSVSTGSKRRSRSRSRSRTRKRSGSVSSIGSRSAASSRSRRSRSSAVSKKSKASRSTATSRKRTTKKRKTTRRKTTPPAVVVQRSKPKPRPRTRKTNEERAADLRARADRLHPISQAPAQPQTPMPMPPQFQQGYGYPPPMNYNPYGNSQMYPTPNYYDHGAMGGMMGY